MSDLPRCGVPTTNPAYPSEPCRNVATRDGRCAAHSPERQAAVAQRRRARAIAVARTLSTADLHALIAERTEA